MKEDITMDIMEKIEEIIGKLNVDKSLLKKFKKNPTKTIEGLVSGLDFDKESIEKIVEAVKAKVDLTQVGGFLSKLFGKKKK